MNHDSDLDHSTWLSGPERVVVERTCACGQKVLVSRLEDYQGTVLCPDCEYADWVARKEREFREEQVTRGLRRMVNEA